MASSNRHNIKNTTPNSKSALYQCDTCKFESDDLTEVAKHVAGNQFDPNSQPEVQSANSN